jgi:hypothetical protein
MLRISELGSLNPENKSMKTFRKNRIVNKKGLSHLRKPLGFIYKKLTFL